MNKYKNIDFTNGIKCIDSCINVHTFFNFNDFIKNIIKINIWNLIYDSMVNSVWNSIDNSLRYYTNYSILDSIRN